MTAPHEIPMFPNFQVFEGFHCISHSLAKMCRYQGINLSETTLLGLGAGIGYRYYAPQGHTPLLFGRANMNTLYQRLGERTGIQIKRHRPRNSKRAEHHVRQLLTRQIPVMVFADLGLLPNFRVPQNYHFGGHTLVVCGYDGENSVLISDLDQRNIQLKTGIAYPLNWDAFMAAWSSESGPMPAKNQYFSFDFTHYQPPGRANFLAALLEFVCAMQSPIRKEMGLPGLAYTLNQIAQWPRIYLPETLRLMAMNLYAFVEAGGTGGGMFRYMLSNFLTEAAGILELPKLDDCATEFKKSGDLWSHMVQPLRQAFKIESPSALILSLLPALTDIIQMEARIISKMDAVLKEAA